MPLTRDPNAYSNLFDKLAALATRRPERLLFGPFPLATAKRLRQQFYGHIRALRIELDKTDRRMQNARFLRHDEKEYERVKSIIRLDRAVTQQKLDALTRYEVQLQVSTELEHITKPIATLHFVDKDVAFGSLVQEQMDKYLEEAGNPKRIFDAVTDSMYAAPEPESTPAVAADHATNIMHELFGKPNTDVPGAEPQALLDSPRAPGIVANAPGPSASEVPVDLDQFIKEEPNGSAS